MSHDPAHPPFPSLDSAITDARRAYRMERAPVELESSVLSHMRVASEQISKHSLPSSAETVGTRIGNLWQRFTQTRFMPAMAGSLATITLLAISAPWWLQFARESHEVATPFMLVTQPQTAQLDVSQMVRVNVTREAMLDFGIPVPPQRLGESVKAEMLMGARGDVLAVRFIEPQPEKRWRWQLN
jgi:hypothetical protein